MLTPAYPGLEIEVEALRENPSVIAELTVFEVIAARTVRARRSYLCRSAQ